LDRHIGFGYFDFFRLLVIVLVFFILVFFRFLGD
jgi:hypothetical protein